jgi:hypothetical protein
MGDEMQEELRKAADHMQRMSQVQQQESAWRSSDEKVSLLDLKDEATVVVGGVDKYAVRTSSIAVSLSSYPFSL